MNGDEATLAVIDALEAVEMPYMLVGSFSSNFYGIPRATEDADFVIQVGSQPISRLTEQLGSAFRLDPQLAFETITATTRNVLLIAEIPFKIELFHLSDDPHDQERFRRRQKVRLFDRDVWLPSAEDVILTKLRWALLGGRSKDREDARDVVAVQGTDLDWDYIHAWSDRHGTRGLLEEIRRSIPPI